MKGGNPDRKASGAMVARPTQILIGVLLLALVAVIAVPGRRTSATVADPAAEALAMMESFEARLAPPPGIATGEVSAEAGGRPTERDRPPIRDIFRAQSAPIGARNPDPDLESTPGSVGETTAWPSVSGVLLDGDHRQAVIAGRVLAEGDSVAGTFLVEVRPESVLLWRDGEFHRVTWRTGP